MGKIFRDEKSVLNYLVDKKIITKKQSEQYLKRFEHDEGGLEDIVEISHIPNFPKLSMCDYCLGEEPFLGYEIDTDVRKGTNPDKFEKDVNEAKENWKNIFGDIVELESITQYS